MHKSGGNWYEQQRKLIPWQHKRVGNIKETDRQQTGVINTHRETSHRFRILQAKFEPNKSINKSCL